MKHLKITISGRVQGVFFRASTKDEADRLGIKGFVRNERDGSVYVEAEGDETTVDQFLAWCRVGPNRARVDDLKVIEAEVRDFDSFVIQR